MFFDTHAHYDDPRFDEDRDELLAILPKSGVELVVDPGCDRQSSEKAIALSERYEYIYAAVGWHPHEAESFDGGSAQLLREWSRLPKVKAIGEIGLDYYYDTEIKPLQRRIFCRQMELAEELGMPVIVHDRDAHADCLEIVKDFPKVRGVFHCYSGSPETAEQLLSLGWYLGFTGSITFKNARRAPETIELCPLERLMIETDSPYLAPTPHRGERCDSRLLVHIAQKIADIKQLDIEEIARITKENGKRFFGIRQ